MEKIIFREKHISHFSKKKITASVVAIDKSNSFYININFLSISMINALHTINSYGYQPPYLHIKWSSRYTHRTPGLIKMTFPFIFPCFYLSI